MTDTRQPSDPRTERDEADARALVDLRKGDVIHLGLGARSTPVRGFSWDPGFLEDYDQRFAADGDEGRLFGVFGQTESWPTWERHPAGEEIVMLLSGRADLIQQIDGQERRVSLQPGQAVVNPVGVWHTADVHEPGEILFVTPGRGTENKPR
jgi:quercetin dioxygenase-like cupin family protein